MKKILVPVLLYVLALVWLLFVARPVEAQLLITEIMPDPAAAQDSSEWVEIYNYTEFDLPLSQIKINDKALTSEKEVLGAKSYLIVTKNVATFLSEFGEVANVASASISLTNSGGNVQVKYGDSLIDSLNYSSAVSNKSIQRSGPLCSLSAWTLFSPGLPFQPENSESCWPTKVVQTLEDVEIELNTQDNTRSFRLTDTDNVFGWKTTANEQDKYYLGNRINSFLLGNEVIIYTYQDHQETSYKVEEVFSLPVLQFTSEINSENKITQINLIALDLEAPEVLTELEIDIAGNKLIFNGYLFLNDVNILEIIPNVQFDCATSCTQPFTVKVNSREWSSGELVIPNISASSTSSTSSTLSTSSTTTSQPTVINAIEMSEVFAAPVGGQSEWIEIYNYGNEELDLTNWYFQDNRGKHILGNIVVQPGEYRVVDNLKISLNNAGELIQLFNAQHQEIDRWQQPEVANSESAIRLFENTRHAPAVIISMSSSAGRENELVKTAESSATSKSVSTSTQSTTIANKQNKIETQSVDLVDMSLPDLQIRDFSNIGEPAPPIDTSVQYLILIVVSVIQAVLTLRMLWKIQAVKDMFQTGKKYILRKLFSPTKETKRADNLQVLRY